jgi:CHAT domain-containing protein
VAHGLLTHVPWWAVPSLRELDVRTAPTLYLFPRRRGVASLSGRALVIGDPSGDLPVARAEATKVRAHLHGAGVPAEQLVESQATEHAIAAMLSGARMLHFSGHGMSDLSDASRSALHAYPDDGFAGHAGAALIEELAAQADWRAGPDERREADLNLGAAAPTQTVRLIEETFAGDIVLRHLEHRPTGTLLAVYVGGRLIHLAELWSAGDMAVSGALRGVRLAVLSACQTGGGVLGLGPDEFAGLPAALILAGVRTVVCTAWKVDDALAALAVDLLWEELCRDPGRTVDLAATVSGLRRRLAGMPKAEAAARLEDLRSIAPTSRARFLLEACQARIREGPSRPFAHPYDWAPLFVLGEPLVTWRTR